MRAYSSLQAVLLIRWVVALASVQAKDKAPQSATYPTRSGIRAWVDPATPDDRQTYVTSRGRTWDLTMSDEFNTPNRSFRPGHDHMWTSLEKPDGVNGALELYSHNMTSTQCDDDDTCYFYIKSVDEHNILRVYNMYTHPPGFVDSHFYYRAAMVQSWNKFCYQGGMIETRVQLPGVVEPDSGNPDLETGSRTPVATNKYYPTWPGIWMLGNLGRAIFSASTNRMWPFSYDKCEPELFNASNQRISACTDDPGFGLNPNQGRGAPEIDVLEGAAALISSSLQIGPGMPDEYRIMGLNYAIDDPSCIYSGTCNSVGANFPDVPTAHYMKARGHKSWYQGMRYASNNQCQPDADKEQAYKTIAASLQAGITENTCSLDVCPASRDVNGDLGPIDKSSDEHWNVNVNGTCFPLLNVYTGSYLCDPDNTYWKCSKPRNESTTPRSSAMSQFNYQMDAISSNWPVHIGAYMDFVTYQLEWVTGKRGYVRWNLEGSPLFEVPSESIWNVPQNENSTNPQKLMVEEPLYVIFNVALSTTWGATPPNAGNGECRGNGTDKVVNTICDAFPLYLKIDYIRLYQDLGTDLDADNYMAIGCDPKTHPTKEWIEAHLDEYEDNDNPHKEVAGKAFCTTDDDCTIGGTLGKTQLKTGKCVKKRCECTYASSWGGPRCTTAVTGSSSKSIDSKSINSYGPPFGMSIGVAVVTVFFTVVAIVRSSAKQKKAAALLKKQGKTASSDAQAKQEAGRLSTTNTNGNGSDARQRPRDNYSQNFV